MNVILYESIPNLGLRGSIVSVTPGYFRNFLSPKQLAVEASDANKKRLQDKIKRLEAEAQSELNAARTEADRMELVTLNFQLKAGQDDKLFGSVTNADIAEGLAKQGYTVDKHRVVIGEPIKRLGMFTVEVKVHHEVVAKIKVLVEKAD